MRTVDYLHREALTIHPLIQSSVELFKIGLILEFDLVGIFILAFLSVRRPNRWSNGRLTQPISNETSKIMCVCSVLISSIPHLLDLVNSSYIQQKLKLKNTAELLEKVRIFDIFNLMQFSAIKCNSDNYLNRSIVHWAMNERPFKLMTHVPSPLRVLKQQANGERVITMFTTLEDLSSMHSAKLTYMAGMVDHNKDAFEFLIHDCKHMENFVDSMIYSEQIGFFRAMLALHNPPEESFPPLTTEESERELEKRLWIETLITHGNPKGFFLEECGYDDQLWLELEYVISDMNCFSTHLLRYLFAKMVAASERKVVELQSADDNGAVMEDISLNWQKTLLRFGMAPPSSAATIETEEEWQLAAGDCYISRLHGRVVRELVSSSDRSKAYEASMALLDIRQKKRPQWTEIEAEAVRTFFKALGKLS